MDSQYFVFQLLQVDNFFWILDIHYLNPVPSVGTILPVMLWALCEYLMQRAGRGSCNYGYYTVHPGQ